MKSIPLPICFLVIFSAMLSPSLPAAPLHPDIVVFLGDDYSQLDSSVYGSKEIATPSMQRLANAGMSFENAFVASPSCAPSRAALLTGLMPSRNGAEVNHARPHKDIRKWPSYFQELGYNVVAFGKISHYQHTADYGFDHYEHDTFHDEQAIPSALKYLEARGPSTTQPICFMVGSNWPHVPWPKLEPGTPLTMHPLPAASVDTTKTREWRTAYIEAVSRLDDELGQVYDLSRKVLGEDTVFLFSSDHGTQWPFGKWNCYDAGIRVPLMVEWPKRVAKNTRSTAMVSWVDFLPTLLEVAGGKPPEKIDGISFAPVLLGKSDRHRTEIYSAHTGDGRFNIYPMRSLRTDRWKYIWNLHPEFAFTTHIDLPGDLGGRDFWSTWEAAAETSATAREIVRRYHQRPGEELFDLQSDPDEQKNLAGDAAQVERLAEMRGNLRAWMRSQDDQSTVPAKPRLLTDPTAWGPGAKK